MVGLSPSIFSGAAVSRKARSSGFTLIEMLVATVILVIIVAILFTITQETSTVWKNTTGKVEVFKSARSAFEVMTRTLSQATLNTYYDYVSSTGTFVTLGSGNTPTSYGRNSDLQIVAGQGSTLLPGLSNYTAVTHAIFFQAPLGMVSNQSYANMNGLLNSCGFYIAYGPDIVRPKFVPGPSRNRYRLMQFVQPSDNLSIYSAGKVPAWYLSPITTDYTNLGGASPTDPISNFVLSENVVALIILPKLSAQDETTYGTLSPNYSYDSSTVGQGGSKAMLSSFNQMPPIVQVTMVAIDEASALKLGNPTAPPNTQLGLDGSLFQTVSSFDNDLKTLKNNLVAAHLSFRVFQTDVAIRSSKWTTN